MLWPLSPHFLDIYETYLLCADSYGRPRPAEPEPHSGPVNPLDPVHAKLVLLFKVFLKLLVFKVIVKFIAIICVLLFLPKLSGLGLAKGAMDDANSVSRTGKLQIVFSVLTSIQRPQGNFESSCFRNDIYET